MAMGAGDDPSFTEDRLEIYYNDAPGLDILRRTRATLDGPWSPPELVTMLNTLSNESTPEISSDGLTIRIGSTRPGGKGDYDIMTSTRSSRAVGWTTPAFDRPLNSVYPEHGASVTADGRTVVFTSARSGTDDLWIGTWASATGAWEDVRALGLLNSGGKDTGSHVTPDGLSLYFSTDRAGDFDLYESHRASTTEPFTVATRMFGVNTPMNEEDPWVSPDGQHLYFMRGMTTATGVLMHSTLMPAP